MMNVPEISSQFSKKSLMSELKIRNCAVFSVPEGAILPSDTGFFFNILSIFSSNYAIFQLLNQKKYNLGWQNCLLEFLSILSLGAETCNKAYFKPYFDQLKFLPNLEGKLRTLEKCSNVSVKLSLIANLISFAKIAER